MERSELIAPFGEQFVDSLVNTVGNQAKAARELGISRVAVTRMRKGDLGVSVDTFGHAIAILEDHGQETEALIDGYSQLVEQKLAGNSGMDRDARSKISIKLQGRPVVHSLETNEQIGASNVEYWAKHHPETGQRISSDFNQLFLNLLRKCGGNYVGASRLLGVSPAVISRIKTQNRPVSPALYDKALTLFEEKGLDTSTLQNLRARTVAYKKGPKTKGHKVTSEARKNISEGQQIRRQLERGMKKDQEVIV